METPTKYDFKWYKDDFDTNPRCRGRLFANRSTIEDMRSKWEPPVPSLFTSSHVSVEYTSSSLTVDPKVAERWPEFSKPPLPVTLVPSGKHPEHSSDIPFVVGIILAGEWVPSSGTHNIIVGLVRELYARHGPNVTILGFLGGPQGFARSHYIQLTPENVCKYINQGGADMLGFGSLRAMELSDYLEIETLFEQYKLDGLVFIGGPNELSHMSQLIQYSRQRIPKRHPTIVGIFQSPNGNVFVPEDWVPITLGFDSTRTALAEYVGNIAMDGVSSGRGSEVVNIIRCGSTTVTMEVALQVCPAFTILAEEVWEKNFSLDYIVGEIERVVSSRIASHIASTTILISEKFYPSLHQFVQLQKECQNLYRSNPTIVVPIDGGLKINPALLDQLTHDSRQLLVRFPQADQVRIARAYDSNGCPTWPEIEPEKLLAKLLGQKLSKILVRPHSIGSEARCPLPTDFDCSLGLALGMTAAHLVTKNFCHGYVAAVRGLGSRNAQEWNCGGFPIACILRTPLADSDGGGMLTSQWGGASQELINLARQRMEKESLVPRIELRPEKNISNDCLFKLFDQVRNSFELISLCKQPGPYQLDSLSNDLSFAVKSVYDSAENILSISENFSRNRTTDVMNLSPNQFMRLSYRPQLPKALAQPHIVDCPVTPHRSDLELVQSVFPRTFATTGVYFDTVTAPAPVTTNPQRIGIVFLGRHVPGCHNIVWALCDSAKNRVFGFRRGLAGLLHNDYILIDSENFSPYRNQSGIDLLGRTETPFKSRDEMFKCVQTCKKLKLDGLVLVGGIGTHADTAILSETMVTCNIPTRVVGIPASVENDIPLIHQTLGHNTACRVYGSLIGSLATLAASSKRQWCFVRISGRSGLSQVVARSAIMTHPNLILLAEEISANRQSLADIVNLISDLISERAKNGHDFGLVVFPETVLERVEEVVRFSNEIVSLRLSSNDPDWTNVLRFNLSPMSAALYDALPARAKAHIHHYNGSHEVRLVDPEILLESLVGKELQRRKIFSVVKGSYVSTTHALSSQGRSSMPSDLDCDLAFAMGTAANHLIRANRSGLLVNVKADESVKAIDWDVEAVPITSIVTVSRSFPNLSGPQEYRVEIEAKEFCTEIFRESLPPPSLRRFVNPGPLQFSSQSSSPLITSSSPATTIPPSSSPSSIDKVASLCSHIMSLAANASDEKIRRVIGSGLKYVLDVLGESPEPFRVIRGSLAAVTSPRTMRRVGSQGRIVRVWEQS